MYEIKVLDSNQFDEVSKSDPRYAYVDDSNMGFADRQKGVAYIRGSNIHDLNKYLINHELEELESDESTHEDANGIRHKKFFKDLFLPLISGGLIKSEAPQREAAQTQYVEGYGNVPRSQAQFLQPIQPQSGSYSPTSSMGMFNVSGSGRVPEPNSGSYSPTVGTGALGGGLESMSGNSGLSPELLQKLRGNYEGRLVF